jgi:hypothetical protein
LEQNLEKRHPGDGWITALAFGGFLIIVGLLFVLTPNLWHGVTSFFDDITTRPLPFGGPNSTISLLAPLHPEDHQTFYNALLQFDIAFGILQMVILGLRFGYHSPTRRIAETLGNAVFWLGAALLTYIFLLQGTLESWFEFWAALIVIVGVSFVARAFVHFAKR